jgi:hypothetical protein
MMPRKLDPKIAEILRSFGYGPEACWDCHGVWVVYHRILEEIAAQAGIQFEMPMVLEANGPAKSVALCVSGSHGDKAEWSIGEAAPGNNKNSYPYAMAEKRAKDRVVLKLIGLHGLAYSEDEAETFKAPSEPPAREAPDAIGALVTARRAAENCTTRAELRSLLKSLPKNVRDAIVDEATALAAKLPEDVKEAA